MKRIFKDLALILLMTLFASALFFPALRVSIYISLAVLSFDSPWVFGFIPPLLMLPFIAMSYYVGKHHAPKYFEATLDSTSWRPLKQYQLPPFDPNAGARTFDPAAVSAPHIYRPGEPDENQDPRRPQ